MSYELTAAQIDALERAELARLDNLATGITRAISFPALSILQNKTDINYSVVRTGDFIAKDTKFLTELLEEYFTTNKDILNLSDIISTTVRAANLRVITLSGESNVELVSKLGDGGDSTGDGKDGK